MALAKIGGGGFVTGGDVADDGTKIFRTDTSGAYLYNDTSGEFDEIVPRNIPSSQKIYWNGTGVYEALISASDSSVIYVAYGGRVWKSTDGGASFASKNSGMSFNANKGNMRTLQRHGDIDPADPDHMLLGTRTYLYRTTDGGETWATIPSCPVGVPVSGDGTPGYSGFAFDRTSALTNGRTSRAIVCSGGVYYETTDGCETWSVMSGAPVMDPNMAEFDDAGRYFTSGTGLYRYASGSWFTCPIPDTSTIRFGIDPDDNTHIWISRGVYLNFAHSNDSGTTWSGANWTRLPCVTVDNIPWHEKSGYFHNNLVIDVTNDEAWWSGGNQGIASCSLSNMTQGADPSIDCHGIGIENICGNVLVPVGSRLHAAVWDEGLTYLDRANGSYPTIMNEVGGLGNSFGLDCSVENSDYLAVWYGSNTMLTDSGWSDDNGDTWTPFTALPTATDDVSDWGSSGTLAYSGISNIIVVTSNTSKTNHNALPHYTLDRGETWSPIGIGVTWPDSRLDGIHNSNILNREIICSDKSTLLTFYLIIYAEDDDFSGLYRTLDGGANFTKMDALPGARSKWYWNVHIESPVAGHVWIGAGQEGTQGVMGGGYLYYSTGGGASIQTVTAIREPVKFGFGAPAAPGEYPVLFFEGYYNGVPGFWMVRDILGTPVYTKVAPYANNHPHQPRYIAGDPDIPGRCWVAKSCAGVHFVEAGVLL